MRFEIRGVSHPYVALHGYATLCHFMSYLKARVCMVKYLQRNTFESHANRAAIYHWSTSLRIKHQAASRPKALGVLCTSSGFLHWSCGFCGFTALAFSIFYTTIPESFQVVVLFCKSQNKQKIHFLEVFSCIFEIIRSCKGTLIKEKGIIPRGMAALAHIGEASNFSARDSASKDYDKYRMNLN